MPCLSSAIAAPFTACGGCGSSSFGTSGLTLEFDPDHVLMQVDTRVRHHSHLDGAPVIQALGNVAAASLCLLLLLAPVKSLVSSHSDSSHTRIYGTQTEKRFASILAAQLLQCAHACAGPQ